METKRDRRIAPGTKEITVTNVSNKKPAVGFSPVKILCLEVIIFPMIYRDTYRMIRPEVSFRNIKIGKKYKHLSYFPTTPWALV